MIETSWVSKQTVESEQKALSTESENEIATTKHVCDRTPSLCPWQAIPGEGEGLHTPSPEMLLGH